MARSPTTVVGAEKTVSVVPWSSVFLAATDVFVLPSVSEGLSNALLESLASGLPVLGSRVGGTAEAVQDGVSGLLFDGEPEAAAGPLVARLAGDAGLRERLCAGARERAKAYAMETVAARVEALYRVC